MVLTNLPGHWRNFSLPCNRLTPHTDHRPDSKTFFFAAAICAYMIETQDAIALLHRAQSSVRLSELGIATAGIEFDPDGQSEYVCFRDPDKIPVEFYVGDYHD